MAETHIVQQKTEGGQSIHHSAFNSKINSRRCAHNGLEVLVALSLPTSAMLQKEDKHYKRENRHRDDRPAVC